MDYATALRQGMPISPEEFEAIRQQANEQMTPFTHPQPGALPQEQSWAQWASDPSFNEGRGRYGLVPSVARGASRVMDALPDMSETSMAKYLRNSIGSLARAPGQIAEMSPMDMAKNAFAATAAFPASPSSMAGILRNAWKNPDVARGAVTGDWAPIKEASRAREVKINTAPPHTLQKRDPLGRFQKFDAETRKVRDQAIKDRARQKAPEHRMEYDASGEPLGSKHSREYLSKI
jgi:hypothetical protein